ncbi:MAG: ANTAR domain-containing response regulator [Pseudorhodobacter sp.]
MQERLSILVVTPDAKGAGSIVQGLRNFAAHDMKIMSWETGLDSYVTENRPDIVLVDLTGSSRDIMEEVTHACGPMDRPVVIFIDRSEADRTRAAIEAGVSAYIVNGLQPGRIRPILEMARARFDMMQQIRNELEGARTALEDRKVIDRAKTVLMQARGLDEQAAYTLMRKTAMDQGKRVAEIARQLVAAADILISR